MAPSNDSPRPRFYRSAPRDTSSYGVSQGEYAERFNTTRPSPYYENPAGPPQGFSYRSHYAPMSPPVREANTFARPFYEIPDYYHPDASANFQRASAFSTGHYYGEPSFHKEEAGDNPFQHARTSSNPFYAQPDYYHPAATANLRQASAFSTDNYYGQPSFYYQGANANPFQQNNVTSNPSYGRPILHHREDNDQRQGGSQLIRRFPQASNANSWGTRQEGWRPYSSTPDKKPVRAPSEEAEPTLNQQTSTTPPHEAGSGPIHGPVQAHPGHTEPCSSTWPGPENDRHADEADCISVVSTPPLNPTPLPESYDPGKAEE